MGNACTCFLSIANWAMTWATSGFLYPFLGKEKQQTGDAVAEVAASIQMKVRDDARLREHVAREQAETISNAAIGHDTNDCSAAAN